MPRTNTLHIKTPEGIAFALVLAGPVARFLAWAIDLGCIFAIMTAINMGIQFAQIVSVDLARAAIIISYFVVSIGYGILCEWRYKGQTFGKRLMSLRVMDIQGLRLQFSQIVIRNLLRLIDSLPVFYLVGGFSCLLSPKGQRLGDLAANTIAIREPRIPRPDLEQLLSHKYNSLRDQPHLAARLRQRTSPREAGIALQALLRRNEMEPASRVDLFAQIAAHFKEKIALPQEITDGITDEQFVRNVVEVLFVTRSGSPKNGWAKSSPK